MTTIVSNKNNEKIPVTVFMIGLMMFMANASYVIIYAFCGVYLKDIGGVSLGLIGILEGLAEATSFLLKFLSGIVSDHLGRRKPLVLFGQILAALSRLVLALSPVFGIVVFSRIVERIGNGLQATPRDAIVGDITAPHRRGEAYGIKRMLAQAGSVFGAFLGYFVMAYTNDDYLTVFKVACIPSFIAVAIVLFFVKENKQHKTSAVTSEIPLPDEKRKHPIKMETLLKMGRSYWMIILIAAVFMLARFGENFMLFHGKENFGILVRFLPLIMITYNAGHSLISYPIGYIADRMNRYWVLAIGILMLVLADFCLATAQSSVVFFIGTFFWGVQFGITQNVFATLISQTVPENLRGTGFGIFNIVCAISCFSADALAGFISQNISIYHTYIYGGVMAIISLLFLIFAMGYRGKKETLNKRS
ncbi:MAG: putative MFS-type transporter YfcJ [Holosporales bacterium]